MSNTWKRDLTAVAAGAALLLAPAGAQAGEADNLQRMIEQQKTQAATLERLDTQGVVKDEIAYMRVWVDEAWKYRSEEEYDKALEVVDRCSAQAEMIQKKIDSARAAAQAAEREAALKVMKDKAAKTRALISQAQVQKKAMEMNIK